jgi:hypothetical protein
VQRTLFLQLLPRALVSCCRLGQAAILLCRQHLQLLQLALQLQLLVLAAGQLCMVKKQGRGSNSL